MNTVYFIEIKYAPGGDENIALQFQFVKERQKIEIKYAPGGDENLIMKLLPRIITMNWD